MTAAKWTEADDRRLWSYVLVSHTGCWLWQASCTTNGYGKASFNGKQRPAHRVFYEQLVGAIPEGLDLDHLCRIRNCVNPDHLEPVTRSENLRRGEVGGWWQAQKTHCPQGHPYDEANTCHSGGKRHCRTCSRKRAALRRSLPASTGAAA